MKEYFDLGHAELVPPEDLTKSPSEALYLPMHAVRKESSTTTKICAVFDASMKTMSGVSLNDILMVGPTVHSPLLDVLLRFRMHRMAIVADISKMYRAIELTPSDRDLHRFVWRASPRVVALAITAEIPISKTHTSLLLPERSPSCVNATTWFQ